MEIKRMINLLILDASGSMDCIYDQALSGVNETIQSIRMSYKKHPELEQSFTLASFNSGPDYLSVKYSSTPISEVKEITKDDYEIGGCTALYDAMGEMISELRRKVTPEDRVLVTVITDGYENASQHWTGAQIKSFVDELRHKGWTFAYIGANHDVEAVAGSMGIRNTMSFDETLEAFSRMSSESVRCRERFVDKLLQMKASKMMCLEEDDDYFKKEEEGE